MFKNRGMKTYLIIGAAIFILGMFLGSFYAAGLQGNADSEVADYLKAFLSQGFGEKAEVFKNSLIINFRVFALMFLAGFFKLTIPITIAAIGFEGFISGFTTSSFIKVFGIKGLLLGLSGILASVVFIVNLVFFGAWSMKFSLCNGKNDRFLKKNYLILSLICLTIFCITSLIDGYITTTFMGFAVTKL